MILTLLSLACSDQSNLIHTQCTYQSWFKLISFRIATEILEGTTSQPIFEETETIWYPWNGAGYSADKYYGNLKSVIQVWSQQSSLTKATTIQVEGSPPVSSVETNVNNRLPCTTCDIHIARVLIYVLCPSKQVQRHELMSCPDVWPFYFISFYSKLYVVSGNGRATLQT